MKYFYLIACLFMSMNIHGVRIFLSNEVIDTNDPWSPLSAAIQENNLSLAKENLKGIRLFRNALDEVYRQSCIQKNTAFLKELLKSSMDENETFNLLTLGSEDILSQALNNGTEAHLKLLLQYPIDPFAVETVPPYFSEFEEQKKKNHLFLHVEKKKHLTTLLHCLKETHPDMPTEMH